MIDSINNLTNSIEQIFGEQATAHFTSFRAEQVRDLAGTEYAGVFEYVAVFIILALGALIFSSYGEGVTDILRTAFSFHHLKRKVASINISFDRMARMSSLLFVVSAPLIVVSNTSFADFTLPMTSNIMARYCLVALAVLLAQGVNILICKLISLGSANKLFFAQLQIVEKVSFAGCALVVLPFALPLIVHSPYDHYLVKVLSILMCGLVLHNLVLVCRFFITENISILRFFLYLCTVKAVVCIMLIYYCHVVFM